MIRYFLTVALAIAAALVHLQAKAEKVVVYREGQLVNPQEVADVLGKTRSIRLLDDKPSAAAARADTASEASALALPVRFAFGSADILPAARIQLDALAQGIKLLPAQRIVTVEGHTDAVGDDGYNLQLSRARAQAVRDYLVQQHGIESARLRTVGHGEGRPLEGSDPGAAVNRRVQFRGS